MTTLYTQLAANYRQWAMLARSRGDWRSAMQLDPIDYGREGVRDMVKLTVGQTVVLNAEYDTGIDPNQALKWLGMPKSGDVVTIASVDKDGDGWFMTGETKWFLQPYEADAITTEADQLRAQLASAQARVGELAAALSPFANAYRKYEESFSNDLDHGFYDEAIGEWDWESVYHNYQKAADVFEGVKEDDTEEATDHTR